MARHREREGLGSKWWIGLLAGVLIGGLGAFAAVSQLGTSSSEADPLANAPDPLADCTSTTQISAVAPGVVLPLLNEAAAQACIELDLTEAAGREGVRASETTDLWLTDSSLWRAARHTDPGTAVSIASSPIVASANSGTASELGTDATVSWPTLLSTERTIRLGFHDPSSTATGLLAAWPLLKAQRDISEVPYTALAWTAQALAQPAIVGTPVLAAPPNRVLLFSGEYAASPSAEVQVLRGAEGEPYMDFPAYNVAQDANSREAVNELIDVLASDALADQRAAAQLREPDGTAGFDTTELGTAARRMLLPNEGSTIKLYGLSASGSVRGRVLVALDVSSSMGAVQADGTILFDAVRSTALIAMSALQDHTSVGVWLFGNNIDGEVDHRELVPVAPLGENREAISTAVEDVSLIPGTTGALYPTILAGYQHLQEEFDPGAAQSLVVMTNGRTDPRSGMSVKTLISEIKKQEDPDKHIRVMGVGFGPKADIEGLRLLSQEFGGTTARVNGPVQMLGLFITMVGQVAAQG